MGKVRDQNHVMMVGRLVREPVMKYTAEGESICQFSIANNRGYYNDKDLGANFFNCIAWRKKADVINEYCRKGMKVIVRGYLKHHTWVSDSGDNRSNVQITVEEITFLDNRKEDGPDGANFNDEDNNPINDNDISF